MEVTNDWIIIYFDGMELKRIRTLPEFKVPIYFLMGLQGFEGEQGSAVSPIDMYIEYVRAWQKS